MADCSVWPPLRRPLSQTPGRPDVKPLEVRVPHALGREEARRRIDDALARARSEYAETLGELEATWEAEDRLQFLMTVMGNRIDGDLEIMVEELIVRVRLPMMAALFAGRIREGVQERLGGLLSGPASPV